MLGAFFDQNFSRENNSNERIQIMSKDTLTDSHVRAFDDYHNIERRRDDLGKGWKCKEIAFGPVGEATWCSYWGIFYQGRKPSNKNIKEMLKQEHFNFDNANSELIFLNIG